MLEGFATLQPMTNTPEPFHVEPTIADERHHQAIAIVREARYCSVALIQRHLRIGYRAGIAVVERLAHEGVVTGIVKDAGIRQVFDAAGKPLPLPQDAGEEGIDAEEALRLFKQRRQIESGSTTG